MATFTKRGSRWLVQIRRKGFAPQTKTFATKADAKAWANEQDSKIDRGLIPVSLQMLRSVSLGDIIERYMDEVTPTKRSAESERFRLNKLRKAPLCKLALADLSSQAVAQYRDERLQVVARGTLRRELSLIHHAIEIARKEWGYRLPENPVALVSQPPLNNARDRRLLPGELERLTDALTASRNCYVRPIVLLAIETALRRGEILNLQWRHVSFAGRTVHIPQTKTDTPRTVPLTDGALKILRETARDNETVFPITANAIKLAWVRATKRAKLDDLHFHDLRHEAISRFFELGLSMPEVAIISGHRDPRMLFRYTHLVPAELATKLAGKTWKGLDEPTVQWSKGS